MKRRELQYFNWPIPVFIRFIKADEHWYWPVGTHVFSRRLISPCSSHFDNHLYFNNNNNINKIIIMIMMMMMMMMMMTDDDD